AGPNRPGAGKPPGLAGLGPPPPGPRPPALPPPPPAGPVPAGPPLERTSSPHSGGAAPGSPLPAPFLRPTPRPIGATSTPAVAAPIAGADPARSGSVGFVPLAPGDPRLGAAVLPRCP